MLSKPLKTEFYAEIAITSICQNMFVTAGLAAFECSHTTLALAISKVTAFYRCYYVVSVKSNG